LCFWFPPLQVICLSLLFDVIWLWTVTMFTSGHRTHPELRLRWSMQAPRTDSEGNSMVFTMSCRLQMHLRWTSMSSEIVPIESREFFPHLIKLVFWVYFKSLVSRLQGSLCVIFLTGKPLTLVCRLLDHALVFLWCAHGAIITKYMAWQGNRS